MKEDRDYRDTIRFLLDGRVITLRDVDPCRTVLQFLREDIVRTGTKEGCAEGDCGACTVVVAELVGERIRARAINSCIQFLPTIDGKALYTVESLVGDKGELHPVQQAMVDCHGSQCGFCTPGFVMSLFALYKNEATPDRRAIDDALAGNLCRCTGYGPIIDAARQMYGVPKTNARRWINTPAGKPADDEQKLIDALHAIAPREPLRIAGAGRTFYAPASSDELSALSAEFPDATILAGGTDVGLWVTKQLRDLDVIIYTGNVAGLDDIHVSDTHIDIGAAASLTDVMPALTSSIPGLEELMLRFASPPIRNAGTLGGNVANGSPIGDTMPALLVLDAELRLSRATASRDIPLCDFYLGYQENALHPGEVLERIRIPRPASDAEVASYKISKRFDQDISAVCGAYLLELKRNTVGKIRIAYGGMAAIPKRARHCEAALEGCEWNEASLETALDALAEDFEPLSDMRASAHYRMQVCRNLLRRFFLETTGNAVESVYAYGR